MTVQQVIKHFRQYEDCFVDSSNCINLTALEESFADEMGIEYGTEEYSQLEDLVFKAERRLVASGDYNE